MKRQTVEEYTKERTGEKPEEKVERLILEAKEIADKNSIPYVSITKKGDRLLEVEQQRNCLPFPYLQKYGSPEK